MGSYMSVSTAEEADREVALLRERLTPSPTNTDLRERPWRIAIIGPSASGKSTTHNAFHLMLDAGHWPKRHRAIVESGHGGSGCTKMFHKVPTPFGWGGDILKYLEFFDTRGPYNAGVEEMAFYGALCAGVATNTNQLQQDFKSDVNNYMDAVIITFNMQWFGTSEKEDLFKRMCEACTKFGRKPIVVLTHADAFYARQWPAMVEIASRLSGTNQVIPLVNYREPDNLGIKKVNRILDTDVTLCRILHACLDCALASEANRKAELAAHSVAQPAPIEAH